MEAGEDIIITRRGKAVELNALWYHALCLLEEWLRGSEQAGPAEQAERLAAGGTSP